MESKRSAKNPEAKGGGILQLHDVKLLCPTIVWEIGGQGCEVPLLRGGLKRV
jgi:hypothetical protein